MNCPWVAPSCFLGFTWFLSCPLRRLPAIGGQEPVCPHPKPWRRWGQQVAVTENTGWGWVHFLPVSPTAAPASPGPSLPGRFSKGAHEFTNGAGPTRPSGPEAQLPCGRLSRGLSAENFWQNCPGTWAYLLKCRKALTAQKEALRAHPPSAPGLSPV